MKLLQLNCWGGKLITPIRRLIEEVSPDIVCLQEAYATSERPGSVFSGPTSFLPPNEYKYTVFGAVYSIKYMHQLGDFGNAIVSKTRIQKSNIVFTRGAFHEDMETLTDDYNIRNFVHAEIKQKNKNIHIITHHGHHDPEGKEGSPENTRQVKILADYIKNLEGPIILTGDFNLHSKSKSLDLIHELLVNLPVKFNIQSTRSELAKRQEVIDYIFVSSDVKVKNFYASNMIVSDHKALILEFDL